MKKKLVDLPPGDKRFFDENGEPKLFMEAGWMRYDDMLMCSMAVYDQPNEERPWWARSVEVEQT